MRTFEIFWPSNWSAQNRTYFDTCRAPLYNINSPGEEEKPRTMVDEARRMVCDMWKPSNQGPCQDQYVRRKGYYCAVKRTLLGRNASLKGNHFSVRAILVRADVNDEETETKRSHYLGRESQCNDTGRFGAVRFGYIVSDSREWAFVY